LLFIARWRARGGSRSRHTPPAAPRAEADYLKQAPLVVAAIGAMIPVLFMVLTSVERRDLGRRARPPWPLEFGNSSRRR
jgi:hypothetical protein